MDYAPQPTLSVFSRSHATPGGKTLAIRRPRKGLCKPKFLAPVKSGENAKAGSIPG
jgi:hypothetical protein